MKWQIYQIVPYYDGDDPDVPGWKVFIVEGNGGTATLKQISPQLWRIEVRVTDAQHAQMIAHPSVTYEGLGREG